MKHFIQQKGTVFHLFPIREEKHHFTLRDSQLSPLFIVSLYRIPQKALNPPPQHDPVHLCVQTSCCSDGRGWEIKWYTLL
jgi:hypothetical protein